MKHIKYTSFKEIDNDLRILALQKEVDKETLKLNFRTTKNKLYPSNLLGGFGGIIQKLVISFVASKLVRKFK